MSLLSTKGIYGLSAMYQLSLSQTQKPMQSKEIAAYADIPQNYLEQLLVLLKQAGLVKSLRGAHGGYLLAKSADTIFIKDILIALEGNLSILDTPVKEPALQLFYEESTIKLLEIFSLPLSELAEYEQRLSQQLHYSI